MDAEHLAGLIEECGFKGRPNGYGELPLQFCPFHSHNFRSPSFQINLQKRLYCCYSCGAGGHIRRLLYHFDIPLFDGINTQEEYVDKLQNLANDLKKEFQLDESEINQADEKELSNYRYFHPYLLERGFTREIILRNKIGFNKENATITIPIYFKDVYYGALQRTVINSIPKYIYPKNLQKSSLFYEPIPVKLEDEEVEIYVEGPLDALKIAQFGYRVRAILGCQMSGTQLRMMENSPHKIILALDNDDPGHKGIEDILQRTHRPDIEILQLPEGIKDPGEMNKEDFDNVLTNRLNRTSWFLRKLVA